MGDIHTFTNRIKSLLQSQSFARACMELMYPPDQPAQQNDMPPIKLAQERIAINLPGVMALAVGMEYHYDNYQTNPAQLLEDLAAQQVPDETMVLFCRFANCTWKASQPFRGIARIERAIFIPFSMLEPTEIAKDAVQISTAAKLFLKMLPPNHTKLAADAWWEHFDNCLQNRINLHYLSSGIEKAYWDSVGEVMPNAFDYMDFETDRLYPEAQLKTAKALAPFYALESTLDIKLATQHGAAIHTLLEEAVHDNLSLYFLHAANLTALPFTVSFSVQYYPLPRFTQIPESRATAYLKNLNAVADLMMPDNKQPMKL